MSELCTGRCYECPVGMVLDDEVQRTHVDAGLLLEAAKEGSISEQAIQLYLNVVGNELTEEQQERILEMEDDYSPEGILAFGHMCVGLAEELAEEVAELEGAMEDMMEMCESGPIQIPVPDEDGTVSADFRCMSALTLTGRIKYFTRAKWLR